MDARQNHSGMTPKSSTTQLQAIILKLLGSRLIGAGHARGTLTLPSSTPRKVFRAPDIRGILANSANDISATRSLDHFKKTFIHLSTYVAAPIYREATIR